MTELEWRNRKLALAALGVVLTAVGTVILSDHFPQQYAPQFFIAKGIVGSVAVLAAVVHMDRAWGKVRTSAQQLRYLALLFGAVVSSGGSIQQFYDRADVKLPMLGGMEFLIVVVIAMAYSLREDLRTR